MKRPTDSVPAQHTNPDEFWTCVFCGTHNGEGAARCSKCTARSSAAKPARDPSDAPSRADVERRYGAMTDEGWAEWLAENERAKGLVAKAMQPKGPRTNEARCHHRWTRDGVCLQCNVTALRNVHGCWLTGADRVCEDGTKGCSRKHPMTTTLEISIEGSRLWRCERELAKARNWIANVRRWVTDAPVAGMYLIDKGHVDGEPSGIRTDADAARTDYAPGVAPDGMFEGALVRNPENGVLGIVSKVRLRGAQVIVGKRGKTQYWLHPEIVGRVVPCTAKAEGKS